MILLPTEDSIRGLNPNQATAIMVALQITSAPPDLPGIRDLLLTARRCLVQEDVDQIQLNEAIALYEALGLDAEQDSDDPLDYIPAILNFWATNL